LASGEQGHEWSASESGSAYAQSSASPLLSETPDKSYGYLMDDAELVELLDSYRVAMEALLDSEAGEHGGAGLDEQANRSRDAPRDDGDQGLFLERARTWGQSNASSAGRFSLACFSELMRGVALERHVLALARAQGDDAEGPSRLCALARSVALQEHELAAKRGRLRHLEAALAARVDGSAGVGLAEKASLRGSLALLQKHVAQRRTSIAEEKEDCVVGLLEPFRVITLWWLLMLSRSDSRMSFETCRCACIESWCCPAYVPRVPSVFSRSWKLMGDSACQAGMNLLTMLVLSGLWPWLLLPPARGAFPCAAWA
jgi:hypothetical protein